MRADVHSRGGARRTPPLSWCRGSDRSRTHDESQVNWYQRNEHRAAARTATGQWTSFS